MQRRSPILEELASLYAESTAGETGRAAKPFGRPFLLLLKVARCESGERYANALADLEAADGSAVVLKRNKRSNDISRVTVPLPCEANLFARIGRPSPTQLREQWSELFVEASTWPVPLQHSGAWSAFCLRRAAKVRQGEEWKPFFKHKLKRARFQLEVVSRLLGWNHPALLRTASAQLAGKSKYLESCPSTLQSLLAEASDSRVAKFEDLGIEDNPRCVVFKGPVHVKLGEQWFSYATPGAASLSEDTLKVAGAIETTASRCVTVENATKFHELCRSNCEDLFVFTSYPNRATVDFLRRCRSRSGEPLRHFHFGDTDPWGFDVLRSLRSLLKIDIAPLHMIYRAKPGSEVLSARDRKKLAKLIEDPDLQIVREELEKMRAAGTKGDFEQESVLIEGVFPYALRSA